MIVDPLLTFRQTAAEALGSVAVELFPKTLLVQGCGTSKLFFYDLILPFEFKSEILPVLEEAMRVKLKQRPAIRTLEMMSKNAAQRMDHQGQWLIAERLREVPKGLVQMIEINGFVDWCEKSFEETWDPRLVFKLVEAISIQIEGRQGVRLIGVLYSEKDQLKEFVKQSPRFAPLSHESLIQSLQLFAQTPSLGEGIWAWLPNGERVRQMFVTWWHREHKLQQFQCVATLASQISSERGDPGEAITLAHRDLFLSHGLNRLAEISSVTKDLETPVQEGLLDVACGTTDRAHLFCRNEELLNECISSLHFITKMPKILCFEFQIVLYTHSGGAQKKGAKGQRLLTQALKEAALSYSTEISSSLEEGESRLTLRLADSLGRWWDGPFLSVCVLPQRQAGVTLLKRSAFGVLERLIALFLEQPKLKAIKSVDELMNALNWSKDSDFEN